MHVITGKGGVAFMPVNEAWLIYQLIILKEVWLLSLSL